MRRILLFLLVAAGTLILSSCLTIEERISLKADGSGVQTTTVDLSSLLENPFMKMAMAEELQKGEGSELSGRIDSAFAVGDELLPLNPQWSAAERELVGRATGNILMDIEEEEGVFTTTFQFNNLGEIEQLARLMENANKPDENDSNPLAGVSNGSFLLSSMGLKGSKFVRSTQKSPSFSNPMEENEDLDAGMMSMMKDMFGDAVIGYRVDFPGKIKKVKGFEGHEIEDNSLVMYFDFMEVMEDPEVAAKALTGEVKFKK